MAVLLKTSFTGDCQTLFVNLEGRELATTYTVFLKHVGSDGVASEGTIPPAMNSFAFTNISAGGLYQIEVKDPNNTVQAMNFIVSACGVDKCLVLLTDKLLSCGCTSPACSAILNKAQKIMLLIKSAESTASRILRQEDLVLVQDAQSQYRKAVQMCDGDCDCGC